MATQATYVTRCPVASAVLGREEVDAWNKNMTDLKWASDEFMAAIKSRAPEGHTLVSLRYFGWLQGATVLRFRRVMAENLRLSGVRSGDSQGKERSAMTYAAPLAH